MDQNMIYIAVGVAVLLVVALLMANRSKSRDRLPSGTRATGATSVPEGGSDEARLAHLADLRSKGLVSEQEFEAQRKQILGKL